MKKFVATWVLLGGLVAAQGMPEGSPQDLYFQRAAVAVSGLAYDCETHRPSDVPQSVTVQQACAQTVLNGAAIRGAVDEAFAELDAPKAWAAQDETFSQRVFALPQGELRTVVGELGGTGFLFVTYVGPR